MKKGGSGRRDSWLMHVDTCTHALPTDCSTVVGLEVPFYFNLRVTTGGNECFCCQFCNRVPATGYIVRRAEEGRAHHEL